MKRPYALLLGLAAIVMVAGLLVWGFLAGRADAAADAASQQPITPAVQVTQNPLGPPTLTVSPRLQQQAGIEVRAAQPASYQDHIQAYGSVLGLQALLAVSNTLASANAQRAIASAKLTASRAALQRAQLLFKDDRNFSRAQLQTAEAAFQTDEATLRAAEAAAQGADAAAEQAWGPVLGKALAANSPLAQALLRQRQILIQITLPLGASLQGPPPRTATIESAGGKTVPARLLSAAASTDPRIQGASYFFTASASSGLLPGMNVVALLPAGEPAQGMAIPAAAVVWLQGDAWIYLRVSRDSFTRRRISTAQPRPDGGYVVAGSSLRRGSMLVVAGAQMLLSQEFSAEIDVSD